MSPNPTRIDSTPIQTSTNVTVGRQTPKTSFGDRVNVGLAGAGDALARGAHAAAAFVPGGAIVSAAVGSVATMSHASTAGAVTASYAGGGVLPIGGPGQGGINTTVGPNAGMVPGMTQQVPGLNSAAMGPQGGQAAAMNSELMTSQRENMELLKVQIAMQRENQLFTTVSNTLKTRHDTVKNSIANVR